jgi:glycosyltransferase involved in cell wall biosynthesis
VDHSLEQDDLQLTGDEGSMHFGPSLLLVRAMVGGGVERYGTDLAQALGALQSNRPLVVEVGMPMDPWAQLVISFRTTRAQIVHSTHLQTPRTGLPVVTTVHDVIPLDHPSSMPSRLRRAAFSRILRRTLGAAARVVVPSRLTAEALLRRGAPTSRVEVIPEGTSEVFRPLTDEERSRARQQFSGGAPYVAAIWSDRPHKNCDLLPEVAERLGHREIKLVCVGFPRDPNLTALGSLTDEDLRLFYGGASSFLLPSLIEGFGLPALEAAACGTPVVCGDEIGCIEALGDGVTRVDVTSDRAVASVLEDLSFDSALRRERAIAAQRAAAPLTARSMAERTQDLYLRVMSNSKAR